MNIPQVGKEFFRNFTCPSNNKPYVEYNYHHTDGTLFGTVKETLDQCRAARDAWINKKSTRKAK